MKLRFCFALVLLCAASGFSQTQCLGYINADSLLSLMPGYNDVARHPEITDSNLIARDNEIVRKTRELDSLRNKLSPLMIQLRQRQIEDMKANYDAYARAVGARERYSLTSYSQAEKDSTLAAMDKKIRLKEHELDSLKSRISPSEYDFKEDQITSLKIEREGYAKQKVVILKGDSTHQAPFKQRLKAASDSVAAKHNCKSVYNFGRPVLVMEGIEYLDFNAEVAKELGL